MRINKKLKHILREGLFFFFAIVSQKALSSEVVQQKNIGSKERLVIIVKENIDLNGDTIFVPSGGVLKFDGGTISNGVVASDNLFSIESGLRHVFKNIKIDIKKGGTLKLNAEWFGITRNNSAEDNSVNFNSLLKSYSNSHIAFQDGTYRFSINHPVNGKGRFVITGETSSTFSDMPRTIFLIEGKPNQSTTFLTLNTDRSTFKYVTFQTPYIKGIDRIGKIGAVKFIDGINPGNIDSAIDGCMFYHLGNSIIAYGRGLSITNSRFQECGGVVLKQTRTLGRNTTQQPPFDGRGLFVNNVRLHWLSRGIQAGGFFNYFGTKDMAFITIQHNKEIPNSTFFGVIMNNIYADGACQLIDCDSPANSFIISNVFCSNPANGFLCFKRTATNIIISNNIIEDSYHGLGNYRAKNIINFEDGIENCTVADNIFGSSENEIISIGSNKKSYCKNLVVHGNIVKDARGLLSFKKTEAQKIRVRNNIVERSEKFERDIRIEDDNETIIRDSIIQD